MDRWITAEQGRFVLFLPVFMTAGVLLYFRLPAEPAVLPALGMSGVCLAGAILVPGVVARAALLCAGCASAGFNSAAFATHRAPAWDRLPRTAVTVTGRVAAVDALPGGRRMTMDAAALEEGQPLARTVRVRLRDTDALALSPGDVLHVRALLQPPPPPAYPGGWDTQRDAFFSGLGGVGFAIGDAVLDRPAPTGRVRAWRETVAARIRTTLPGTPGAIAATLLTGLGSAIPATDRQAFQQSGLAHLLAVAGLHMGIVMGMFFGATRLLLSCIAYTALHWPTKSLSALVALAAGGAYLALTGAHVPTLRSFAMAALVAAGMLAGRRAMAVRGLALAAAALVLLAPQDVMGVSFQMSFSAVLALVAGYEKLQPGLAALRGGAWWRRPVLHAVSLALTSLLAGTASMPFAAYHFGQLNFFYVPANMLAVPLTAFWVMPCCVLALFLLPFGWARLALVPAGWGISGLIAIAHHVAAWPGAVLHIGQMPAWGLALTSLGIAWLGLWRSRLRLAGVAMLAVGLAAPLFTRAPDVVVGPGAQAIAARVGGRVFLAAGRRAGPFDTDMPSRVWGQAATPFPAEARGALACDAAACRFSVNGRVTVLVRGMAGTDCLGAAIALSVDRLGALCTAPVMIDRDTARSGGAVAVFADRAGVTTLTDRAARGDRPWVYVTRPKLPPAVTE